MVCEYFVSFGEEEAVKNGRAISWISGSGEFPLQKNALMVTGESMTFFWKNSYDKRGRDLGL